MKDNTVPLKLIALLANGEFHSGEQLGETLGMSRAAINKHIQTLRDWGVDVFTVPGKGYSLPEPIQLLNAKQILGQLDGGSVAVLPVIDSTNQYLPLLSAQDPHSGQKNPSEQPVLLYALPSQVVPA